MRLRTDRWTLGVAAGLALATVPFAAGTAIAGPTGDCDWVDADAVAELPAAEALGELAEATSFSAALAAAGLDVELEGRGPLTIFAPTNAAIDAIPQNVFDSLLADPDLLVEFVGYHIIVGQQLGAADLAAAGTAPTMTGPVTVEVAGDDLLLNGDAVVTCADIATADANILVINRVLQPPPRTAETDCPPASGSSVPGSSVPGSSVPGSSVPGSSVPSSSAPAGDPCPPAPGSSVPGGTVPASSVPAATVAGSSAPHDGADDTVPDASVPG